MKENEKNTIKLFEYFYNHLYKTNFKLDLSINNQDKVLSNFVKELEKRVIGVSNNFLVSFLSFGFAYFYTKRLKRKITLNWIASKKLLTRFLAREEGTDYYTREFLREYNINLDELRSYLVEQQEVDYLALDKQEELNKARLPDSDARLYNCLQDTTLYNHRSAICLICHQKTFCKNLLKTTNNFVYKREGMNQNEIYNGDSCKIIGVCGYWLCNENNKCLLASRSVKLSLQNNNHKPNCKKKIKIKRVRKRANKNKIKTEAELLRNKDCSHPMNGKTSKIFDKEVHPIFCAYCDKELKYKQDATRDHLYPASRGGNGFFINKVWCCRSCNNYKGDLELSEWLLKVQEKLNKLCYTINRHDFKINYYTKLLKNIPKYIDYVNQNRVRLLKVEKNYKL